MRHAERTVLTFGVVCLIAAAVGTGSVASIRAAYVAGATMVTFSLWSAWRRR
jgi:hypothetical protein